MADRIGVINKGEIILVEDKAVADAASSARSSSPCTCRARSQRVPPELDGLPARAVRRRHRAGLHLRRPGRAAPASPSLLRQLGEHGIDFKDLQTSESSLEEIFVSLVRARP